jgi:CBS domain-containing protein
VAKLMAQSPAGRALVIDGDRLLGIISASDLTSRRRPDWHGDAGGRGDRPANRVATS